MFFYSVPASTKIYTLSLHDALPICNYLFAMPKTKSAQPKWRRRPEHRPQQIIEAAFEVFGECGLAKSRLEDIAKRAGVSKGTIYLYFPNKEDLFREMIRQTAVATIE